MFSIFNLGQSQTPATQASPMVQRLMLVLEQYSEMVPPIVRPLLSSHLGGLQDKFSDETIAAFISKARDMLTYIETGEGVDAGDDSAQ